MNTFFEIQDLMNLYHAELHIPSDRAKHGIPCTNFKTDNTAANVFWVFFLFFFFTFSPFIQRAWSVVTCKIWNVIYEKNRTTSLISLNDPSCVFGITGKHIDISNIIKLFCQRDNIDVS